ncbi:hypothetical protein AF335_09185 [Streptomyces eurocidicus]|nr:AfsR/SARP family transcriptional regulator [Streptomyces eurocidicus]PNE34847.1 hypothetical protein AF335_09185 [Streptomyces eurocidicus]
MSISRGGELAVLPDSRPAALLAALLLRPGQVVSTEYLQRAVWGDEPPLNARATLHTCVLRLRRLFAKFGISDDAIKTLPGGYRLPVSGETLDLARFEELTAAAEKAGDPEREAALLHDALLLWQGEPISNIRSDTLHRDEVPRLQEEWLRAAERWFDIELALGRCGRALPGLRAAVRAHPGHERFWEHLIEALYRTGRQSEALAEYRAVKRYLSDELGVDPRASLRRLELAILRGDELGPPAEARPAPRTEAAPAPRPVAAKPAVVPLPPGPAGFTGRAQEVAALTERLGAPGRARVTAVVSGLPGIGKTALALHTAHLLRDCFPGGRWLVEADAGGDGPRLLEKLKGLGWDPDGPRQLLVLDGVRTHATAEALLPAFDRGTVIVTSRPGLAGLAATGGAAVHRLTELDEVESLGLLDALLGGDRVAAEPAATAELVGLCHGFPLALRIAATRLLLRPRHRIADVTAWLRDDPVGRLAVGDDPAMSVPRLFGAFFSELDPRPADACRILAGRARPDLSPGECAAALDLTPDDTAAMLDRLIDAGVLEDEAPGSYRVPALFRAYVRGAEPASPRHEPRRTDGGSRDCQ